MSNSQKWKTFPSQPIPRPPTSRRRRSCQGCSAQPDVVVVRNFVNVESANLLCEAAAEKLIIGTVRAEGCVEALWRTLSLGLRPAEFADVITAVVGQRLVRKLCSDCMESYAPPPQVLLQLGIPAGRIEAFYRPRQRPEQPNPKEPYVPCRTCGGIGYLGRTAIFELLVVGDHVRKTLKANPNPDLLRRAAQGRHEEPPRRRHPAGRQGRDVLAGVGARVETMNGARRLHPQPPIPHPRT